MRRLLLACALGLLAFTGIAQARLGPRTVSAAAYNQLLQSNPSASKVGATEMQAVLNEAQSQPPVAISAADAQRVTTETSSQLSVKDAVELAQLVRQGNTTQSTVPYTPPNAATSTPNGSPFFTPQTASGVSTTAAIARASTKHVTAHAAAVGTCYAGNVNTVSDTVDILGIIHSSSWDVVNGVTGYCNGPGEQAIVSVGNWVFHRDLNWPALCWPGNEGDYHAGEGTWYGSNSNWIHGLTTTSVGEGIAGFCYNLRSGSAAMRFDIYGPVDCYNDWGFGGNYGCGSITVRYGPY